MYLRSSPLQKNWAQPVRMQPGSRRSLSPFRSQSPRVHEPLGPPTHCPMPCLGLIPGISRVYRASIDCRIPATIPGLMRCSSILVPQGCCPLPVMVSTAACPPELRSCLATCQNLLILSCCSGLTSKVFILCADADCPLTAPKVAEVTAWGGYLK